jgi:hypothetical protein
MESHTAIVLASKTANTATKSGSANFHASQTLNTVIRQVKMGAKATESGLGSPLRYLYSQPLFKPLTPLSNVRLFAID